MTSSSVPASTSPVCRGICAFSPSPASFPCGPMVSAGCIRCAQSRFGSSTSGSRSTAICGTRGSTASAPRSSSDATSKPGGRVMSKVQPIVVERSYQATLSEVWELWTTKEGFESWWGPEGFRVEVHELDARVGGKLDYDMIADAPEAIEAMKKLG